MTNFIKNLFNREAKDSLAIAEFGHRHKDLLIIVCDPKRDILTAMNNDKFVTNRIKSATGKTTHVVKGVISNSLFHKSIDDFIVVLAEHLHLSLPKGNQFYQWLDGAIFKIVKSLSKKNNRAGPAPVAPEKGAILSPIQMGHGRSSVEND